MNPELIKMIIVTLIGLSTGLFVILLYYKKSVFSIIASLWLGTLILMYFATKLSTILPEIFPVYITTPFVVIFVVLCFRFVAMKVLQPLKENISELKRMSSGEIEVNIKQEYVLRQDELGDLSSSVREVSSRLRVIIEGISVSTAEIEKTAEQLSSSSLALAQAVNHQASSLQEISAAMEQIFAGIEQNSDNSVETEKIMLHASRRIEEGNISTNNALDILKEVSGKIAVINDIAFQTELLSLNAAVEAARAGLHGKGFAVVATEVKKLSERSSIAANEIFSLSGKGTKESEKARELMDENLFEIKKTAGYIQKISEMGLEQKSGSTQINASVQKLNEITQQNSASSEELASNAEQLTAKSKHLKGLVDFFKL